MQLYYKEPININQIVLNQSSVLTKYMHQSNNDCHLDWTNFHLSQDFSTMFIPIFKCHISATNSYDLLLPNSSFLREKFNNTP